MKNFIAISSLLLIIGCASTQPIEWDTDLRTSGYDFREYTEQGFLFTPEIYNDQYDAIGLIEITYVPKVLKPSGQGQPPNVPGYRIQSVFTNQFYVEIPKTDRLIKEMYDRATDMGADALSNFRITNETIYNNGTIPIETIKVSGFAIKRTR